MPYSNYSKKLKKSGLYPQQGLLFDQKHRGHEADNLYSARAVELDGAADYVNIGNKGTLPQADVRVPDSFRVHRGRMFELSEAGGEQGNEIIPTFKEYIEFLKIPYECANDHYIFGLQWINQDEMFDIALMGQQLAPGVKWVFTPIEIGQLLEQERLERERLEQERLEREANTPSLSDDDFFEDVEEITKEIG